MNSGGSEQSTYYLARGLGGLGHEVEVLHAERSAGRGVERRVMDGVACTVLAKPAEPAADLFGGSDWWVNDAFADCLERFRPDVVHVSHILSLSDDLPRIAHARGIPVVCTLRDHWLGCPRTVRVDWRQRLCERATAAKCAYCCRTLYSRYLSSSPRRRGPPVARAARETAKAMLWALQEAAPALRRMRQRRRGRRALLANVDWWITPSRAHLAAMIAQGIPADRAEVIRNPIPWTGELTARAARSGRLRFGFLGNVTIPKGILVLLAAFRGLHAADLDIYGPHGSAVGAADGYGDVVGQDNVWLRGPLGEEGKAAALSAVDALIVPSIVPEAGPRVAQEALAAGVPIIGSALGGITEHVREGRDGFLFPAGDSLGLRALLERCIAAPDMIRGLRPSAVEVPTVERHARQVLAVYTRLTERR